MFDLQVKVPNRNQHRNNKANDFYRGTMETLLVYYEKLKTFLNTDQTHFKIF